MIALVIKILALILIVVLYSLVSKEWKKTANFLSKKNSGSETKQHMSSTASEQAVSKELTATAIFQSASNYHDRPETFIAFDRRVAERAGQTAPILIFGIERTKVPYRKSGYLNILQLAAIPLYNEKQRIYTLLEEATLLCKKKRWQQTLLTVRTNNQVPTILWICCLIVLTLVHGSTLVGMMTDAAYSLGNATSSLCRIVASAVPEQGKFSAIEGSKWFALIAVGSSLVKRRTRRRGVRKDLKRRIRAALVYQKDKKVQDAGWAEQRPWTREKRRISWKRTKSLNERWFERLQKAPELAVNRVPASPFRAQCVRYRRKKRFQEEQKSAIAPRVKMVNLGEQEMPSFVVANRYLPTSRGTSVRQEAIQALLQDSATKTRDEEESTEETAVKGGCFARLYRDAERAANANGADALVRLIGDDSEYLDTTAERKEAALPHQITVEISNKARVAVKRAQSGRNKQRAALRKTALRLLNNIGPTAKRNLKNAKKSWFEFQKMLAYLLKQDENGAKTAGVGEIEKARLAEREARGVLYRAELLNPAGKPDMHKLKTVIGRSTFEYRTKVRMFKDKQISIYEHMKARMRILMKNSSRRSPLRVSTYRHNVRVRLRQEYARMLPLLAQTARKGTHAVHHFEYKKYMRRAVKRAWLANYYAELSRLELKFASLLRALKLKAPKRLHTREKRRWALVKMNIKNATLVLWNSIVALRREPLKVERTRLFKNLGIKFLAQSKQSLEPYVIKSKKVTRQPRTNLYKFAYKSVKILLKKKLTATPYLRIRGEGFTRKLFHFSSDRQQTPRAVPILSNRWPRRASFLKTHATQILKHSHTLLTKIIVTAQAKLIAEQIYRGFALHGYEEKSPLRVRLPSREVFCKLPRHGRDAMRANLRRYKLSAMLSNINALNSRARSSGLSELFGLQAHPLARMHQKRKGYLLSSWKQRCRIKRALSSSRPGHRKLLKVSRYVNPDRFVKRALKYVEQRGALCKNNNLNTGVESDAAKTGRLLAQQTEIAKLKGIKRRAASRLQEIKRRAKKLMLLIKARQPASNKVRLSLNVRCRRAYKRPRTRRPALKLRALQHELTQKRVKKRVSRKPLPWRRTAIRGRQSWTQKQKRQQRKQGCGGYQTIALAVRTNKKRSRAAARWQDWKERIKCNQNTSPVKQLRTKNKLHNFVKKQKYLTERTGDFIAKRAPISGLLFSAQRTRARHRSRVIYHHAISKERQSKLRRKLINTRRKVRSRVVREKQKAILAVRRALYLPVGGRRKRGRYTKNVKLENKRRATPLALKRYLHARFKNLWKREFVAKRSRRMRKECAGWNTRLATRVVNSMQKSLQPALKGNARQGHRDKRPVRYSRLDTRGKQYAQTTISKPKRRRNYSTLRRHLHARFHAKQKGGYLRKKSRSPGWHKRMRGEIHTKYKRWLKGLHRHDHTKFVQWVKLPTFVEELHGSFGVESHYGLKLTRLKMLKRWKRARNRLFFRRRSRHFSEIQQRDFAAIEAAERIETKNALKELKEIDDYMNIQGEPRMKKEVFGLVDDDVLPANMEERITMNDRLNHGFTAAEEKLAQLRLQRTKSVAGFAHLQSLRRIISPSTRLRLNMRAAAENNIALEGVAATTVSLQTRELQSSNKTPQLVGGEAENVFTTAVVRQRFSTGRSGIGRLLEKVQSARPEMTMQKRLVIQKILHDEGGLPHVGATFPQIAAVVTAPTVTNFSAHLQERQLVHREIGGGVRRL